jgi:hypothetical protein
MSPTLSLSLSLSLSSVLFHAAYTLCRTKNHSIFPPLAVQDCTSVTSSWPKTSLYAKQLINRSVLLDDDRTEGRWRRMQALSLSLSLSEDAGSSKHHEHAGSSYEHAASSCLACSCALLARAPCLEEEAGLHPGSASRLA